jgi:hypothetical protein
MAVRAGVDERADEFGLVGVDHQRVPVLADEHRAAASGEDPAGLEDGPVGLGERVQDLVGAVAGDRAVVERQRGGVRDVELAGRPALGGDLDGGGVQVDADGPHPAGGEFTDGPPAPAADVDNGVAEPAVGVFPQLASLRQVVDSIEDGEQRGHAHHART